jgi:exodeoxyribonuclease-5
MEWTAQQERALEEVSGWIRGGSAPFFYLGGYAGTGKTTLAKHLAEGVGRGVYFCAYTGKAASVMRKKGCDGATTVHSLVYIPKSKCGERLKKLESRLREILAALQKLTPGLENADLASELLKTQRDISSEKERLRGPAFVLNEESPLLDASLVVVDECSMISEQVASDLLSFQVPLLVLGDPAQLPPVKGAGFFTRHEPDMMLTDVVRQARDNPIIQLATIAREGGRPEPGQYGESQVIPRADFCKASVPLDAQILVGRNETRRKANAFSRERRGHSGPMPVKGDKLVCLRNDHEAGLLNGSTWLTDNCYDAGCGDDKLTACLQSDDDGSAACVEMWAQPFRGEEIPFFEAKEAQHFDYGFALTVHKAQGSEWRDVLLVDESGCFRQDAPNHLYTGITRAAERVTVVL